MAKKDGLTESSKKDYRSYKIIFFFEFGHFL